MIISLVVVLAVAVLVAVSLFLFKLGQLNSRPQIRLRITPTTTHHYDLWPYIKQKLGIVAHKLLRFILEAKDLKSAATKTFESQYQKAKEAYEKALSINSKIPTRWVNLGLCFEALEDYTKAVKALSSAVQLDKLNVNYLSLLADAYVKLENYVRAEEVLEQILALEPGNKTAREKLMRLKI